MALKVKDNEGTLGSGSGAATATVAAAPQPTGSSPWILDSWKDLMFFVATPVLIIPVLAFSQFYFSIKEIGLFVAAFGATGHHLPGMMRAYGDSELFHRFRLRFILAPLFLVTVCIFFAHRNLNGLLVMLIAWGFWHGLAQVYGFVRIYDAKEGKRSDWQGRLDLALCFAWFGAGLVHSPGRTALLLSAFYDAGGPLLSASAVENFRFAWDMGTAAITAAFLVNLLVDWWWGRPLKPVKLLMMFGSFVFWWYAMVHIGNVVLGIALFEIFHDVQYLAIVWVYNRKRVDKSRDVGPFTRFLFRRSWAMIGLYVAMVLGYGYVAYTPNLLATDSIRYTMYGLITASAFFHFYLDGFIWKVRQRETREALGMAGGGAVGQDARLIPGWFTHGLKWGLFVVPVAFLATAEMRSGTTPVERALAVVDAVPDSAEACEKLAVAYADAGNLAKAKEQYERLVRLRPDAEAHGSLGQILAQLGEREQAKEQLERALLLQPDLAEAHSNLGLMLAEEENFSQAKQHYEQALRLNPDVAETHTNLGLVYEQERDARRAKEHYDEALRIQPDYAEGHNGLGRLYAMRGDWPQAEKHFRRAVELDPDHVNAHNNLGNALAEEGDFAQAREHYAMAIRLRPDLPIGHYSLGLLLARQGEFEQAQASLERALRADPNFSAARDSLARLKQMLEQRRNPPQ